MPEDPQIPVSADSKTSFDELFEECRDVGKQIESLADRLSDVAYPFDSLGDVKSHPEGSATRRFAELRDHADMCLSQAARHLTMLVRIRAETSRSLDLLVEMASLARGEGHEALEMMERFHAVFGDERDGTGKVPPETFPDAFLWDVYHRVSALNDLAERFPDHMRHAASQMHGWPMIVSHHLDNTCEFERIAKLLHLGAGYPLDTSPRRKRGGPTAIHDYLEPLVWKLHVLKILLAENEETRRAEEFSSRIKYTWWSPPDDPPSIQILEILRLVPSLPPFTKSSALEWSHRVIVPYILETDGADPARSEVPFLRNIWNHRDVKSAATFRSRLGSAITDFLTRYGRERDPSRYS